jgi:hypothetical protein
MTCTNWLLTISAIIIFVLTLWPGLLGNEITKWTIVITSIVILALAWTGVKCNFCSVR